MWIKDPNPVFSRIRVTQKDPDPQHCNNPQPPDLVDWLVLTCPALDDDNELDPVRLIQGSPPLLVEVGVAEVPTGSVQQPEVVPRQIYWTFVT